MWLIVGLGNPGDKYAKTRHNFGFMVADGLVGRDGFKLQKKFSAEVAELNRDVLVVKPQTFMNNSGEAVGALARYYKVEPQNIWVIADDLDLPLGKIRVRHGGNSGGHHGLESIERHLGTGNFSRIRMGVRGAELRQIHTAHQIDGAKFVLDTFMEKEWPWVEKSIVTAVDAINDGLSTRKLKAHTYEVPGLDDHAGDMPRES